MKVLNEFPNSHHYIHEWLKTDDYLCAHCGSRSLWTELLGDYYFGSQSICVACGYAGYYHDGPKVIAQPNELKILEQLRQQVTSVPTTPKGN